MYIGHFMPATYFKVPYYTHFQMQTPIEQPLAQFTVKTNKQNYTL